MVVQQEIYSIPNRHPREFITLDQAAFDAQKEVFVTSRIHELEQQVRSPAALDSLSGRHGGFIGSHTEIKLSLVAEGYRL